MCLYPRLIKNRRYVANKKNGGVIPPVNDKRTLTVPIGCGKCIECRKQDARKWQIRLYEEIKQNKNGKFITLTFSNESIKELIKCEKIKNLEGYALDNQIATTAVRRFLERWRKKFKKSIRHWLITELGHNGTENIHLHGIVWTKETYEQISKIWQYGYVWPTGRKETTTWVNEQTVNYIIKYITKIDEDHKEYKAITLTSPGIGAKYLESYNAKLNKFNGINTKETYKTATGHEIALPIYYRNKIYSEEEREKLWLQRLDKNERWICGEKVDATNEQDYYNTLKHYRRKNKQLGYGDDSKNWDRIVYENERRKLLYAKRLGLI